MRTKALLCAAALAAGAISAVAQSNVYSLNIVGYVNITQNSGYQLWANPLSGTNNDVSVLFPNAANYPGLNVYKFNGASYDLVTFDPDVGGWNGSMTLNPGDGFWLQVPAGPLYSNTFVGNVITSSTNPVPTGYSLKGSAFPSAQPLSSVLGAPLVAGDNVYFFNGSSYDLYSNDPDVGGWNPSEPVPAVARGFWIQNNSGVAKQWIQNFTP